MRFFGKRKYNSLSFEEVLSDSYRKDYFTDDNLEGSISRPVSSKSILFISSLVFLVSVVFVFRAFSLQVWNYDLYSKKSFSNSYTAVPVPSLRGAIIDSRGEFLAKTVKINNQDIVNFKREYTERIGFGNILGFVSYPKKDAGGKFWQDNFRGVDGLEKFYDQLLSGKSGVKYFEKTADGVQSESFVAEAPVNGKDLHISIDAGLQEFAYKRTRDFVEKNGLDGGAGVIMDINTGKVIALVSYPTYNPSQLLPDFEYDKSSSSTEMLVLDRNEYYKSLLENKKKPFINRAISGVYTPGSIVKPIFALAGLNTGNITPVTSYFSSGQIEVPNPITGKPTIFRDWRANGWTNVAEAIAVSSDVFFYTMVGGYQGVKGVGIAVIDEYSKAFKIDTETGIDLSGEKKGNIPTPSWKEEIFGEPWRLGDSYNSSIGQFGFAVTPIGMARALAAVANGGYLVTPRILVTNSEEISNQKIEINIKPEWYTLVKKGMRMTVTDGIAKVLNLPYVQVAAKTGTAEIGNTKRYVHSWITGFFPYEKPQYVFVFITEKGDRNNAQSPAFIMKDILEWMSIYRHEYLGLDKAREETNPEKDNLTNIGVVEVDISSSTEQISE